MTLYAVQATVETKRGEWSGMKQIPTFYLDSNVQGIISEEHACRIAADILGAGTEFATFHISASAL
jgi:hypothetical protein